MNPLHRVRSWFLMFAGYLVPLVQSLPPLGVWTGLMTLPFATYLILTFTNPVNFSRALSDFFVPFLIPEKALVIIGLLILVYSMAYLKTKKKGGVSYFRTLSVGQTSSIFGNDTLNPWLHELERLDSKQHFWHWISESITNHRCVVHSTVRLYSLGAYRRIISI